MAEGGRVRGCVRRNVLGDPSSSPCLCGRQRVGEGRHGCRLNRGGNEGSGSKENMSDGRPIHTHRHTQSHSHTEDYMYTVIQMSLRLQLCMCACVCIFIFLYCKDRKYALSVKK